MSNHNNNVSHAQKVSSLHPPIGFTCIEDTIYRCFGPLGRHHTSFLRSNSLGISTIINLSGDNLFTEIESLFTDDCNITIINVHSQPDDIPNGIDVSKMEIWIKRQLELIICKCYNTSILLVGCDYSCYDCLLIACLRKCQSWTLLSIISEFRFFIGPNRRLFDMEQFIELFNTDIVCFDDTSIPAFLSIHRLLVSNEEKLLCRMQQYSQRSSSSSGNDVDVVDAASSDDDVSTSKDIDNTLYQMIFCHKHALISPDIQYDASISLIYDKDDDD